MLLHGKCNCGKCTIEIKDPLFAFHCYCNACRESYRGPYSTVLFMFTNNFISSNGPIIEKTTKSVMIPFTGVQRYECASCHQATHSKGYGLMFSMMFANYILFQHQHDIHSIVGNFYYDSRHETETTDGKTKEDVSKHKPTYGSDFVSLVGFLWHLICAVISNNKNCCVKRSKTN